MAVLGPVFLDKYDNILIRFFDTIQVAQHVDLASAWQLFLYYLWAMLFCSIRASNKAGFSFSLRKGLGRFYKVLDKPSVQLISVSVGVK